MKRMISLLVFGSLLAFAHAVTAYADTTIAENMTLEADADWRGEGVVTIPQGVTVDLNGHTLWVSGLAGEGTFTSAVPDATAFDLTTAQSDDSRVKSYSGGTDQALGSEFSFSIQPAWKLFADYASYGTSHRAITAFSNATSDPIDIVYAFDAATAVNSYKLQVTSANSYLVRSPKTWKFFGSVSGADNTWVELDSRENVTDWANNELRLFTFANNTAYTFYRLRITANGGGDCLEFFKLEYGRVQNQVRLDLSQSGGFADAKIPATGTAKYVLIGGTLSANTDLRGLGKVSVVPAESLDLAGHYLKVHAIDGTGKVTTSDTSEFVDLTSPERAKTHATASTNGVGIVSLGSGKYPASAVFDDSISTNTVGSAENPCHFAYYGFTSAGLEINYDFGETTYINHYRIMGSNRNLYEEVPKSWLFEGSNDHGATWTTLDARTNQVLPLGGYAEYSFLNSTSYSLYRLRTTQVAQGSAFYLFEMEYGAVPYNAIYIDPAGVTESQLSGIDVSGGARLAIAAGDTLVLSEDQDLSGVVIDGTIDLQGNTLTVDRLEGCGTITDTTSLRDLTDSDASRVWSPNTYYNSNAGTAKDAFSNPFVTTTPSSTATRVMAAGTQLPVVIDYDFREPTVVDLYKLTAGDNVDRGPGAWEIFGSNDAAAYQSGVDDLSAWKRLDTRFGETWPSKFATRTYGFANSTAYRYYRIRFTASAYVGKDFLTFWKLQYGCSENCGQLRVTVPSGSTVYNKTVSLTGNLRLVKEGSGTLFAAKTKQAYSGGTDITKGTMTLEVAGSDMPFGVAGSDIVIRRDATIDLNGSTGYHFYGFTLDGGTLKYSGENRNKNVSMLNRVRLTDDATIDIASNYGFFGENDRTPTFLDLGGHTLALKIAQSKYCRFYNTTILDGTINVSNGSGWFLTGGSSVTATNVYFNVKAALHIATEFSVLGYEANFYSDHSNVGSSLLNVAGVFKPMTSCYYGCTMLAGSTIDLTAWPKTAGWPMTSAFGNNGKTNLEFADSGEITVNLAGRDDLKTLAQSANPYLFTWAVTDGVPIVPGAKFILDPETKADPAGFRLRKEVRGLRLSCAKGLVLIVQ